MPLAVGVINRVDQRLHEATSVVVNIDEITSINQFPCEVLNRYEKVWGIDTEVLSLPEGAIRINIYNVCNPPSIDIPPTTPVYRSVATLGVNLTTSMGRPPTACEVFNLKEQESFSGGEDHFYELTRLAVMDPKELKTLGINFLDLTQVLISQAAISIQKHSKNVNLDPRGVIVLAMMRPDVARLMSVLVPNMIEYSDAMDTTNPLTIDMVTKNPMYFADKGSLVNYLNQIDSSCNWNEIYTNANQQGDKDSHDLIRRALNLSDPENLKRFFKEVQLAPRLHYMTLSALLQDLGIETVDNKEVEVRENI